MAAAAGRLRLVQVVTLLAMIAIVVGVFGGWLVVVYEWTWTNVGGEPWTFIMRDNPWIWPAGVAVLWLPSSRYLPLRLWVRWIYGVVGEGCVGRVFDAEVIRIVPVNGGADGQIEICVQVGVEIAVAFLRQPFLQQPAHRVAAPLGAFQLMLRSLLEDPRKGTAEPFAVGQRRISSAQVTK